ncbi:MAG: hypothetical protein IJG85_08585 [Eubacteriaceae bacterium]|nr:hypothetical protein [Eubacteriaceae bacterium]
MLTFVFIAGLGIAFFSVLFALAVGIGFIIMLAVAWFRSRPEKPEDDSVEGEEIQDNDR